MGNMRGMILMTLAMAGFAIEDMFIKLLAERLSVGQILLFICLVTALAFAMLTRWRRQPLFGRAFFHPAMMLRNGGEVFGTLCFVTSISLVPLATVSAILQATPLTVTMGAALFLRTEVGWRRWSAIGVGLIGVLIILRPGLEGFDANALFALGGVVGLTMRDLGTRVAPQSVSTLQLSTWSYMVVVPASLVLIWFDPAPLIMPNGREWLWLLAAIGIGMLAYLAITAAMRAGDIPVVTPFRYTRILFAVFLGVVVFAERPDTATLIGAALIIASGLYTLYRENRAWRARLSKAADIR